MDIPPKIRSTSRNKDRVKSTDRLIVNLLSRVAIQIRDLMWNDAKMPVLKTLTTV